ncbi:hypothetical protein [Halomonas sp. BC04]|uniref:hypothetical protein n=1 Tax=Halomonas sp. BC04 TaxID=1403540 RepID=UPI0003ED635A|nr:hypothetical protein [Halomonas sp. BC04]EWH00470.1 hypothetical protein Q427_19400 [Halomonas sp. BC04]
MIDHALALLEMHDLPSWEKDAPLRREMERLRDDVRGYQLAAGHDEGRACRKAAQVSERADRIRAFMANKRHGAQAINGWGFASRGHRYEL